MEIDLDRLKANFLDCPDNRDEEQVWDSPGEEYLMVNILPKCLYGEEFKVRDIDFDAFTEDDIVTLIDEKLSSIIDSLYGVKEIVECFSESQPQKQKIKRFF